VEEINKAIKDLDVNGDGKLDEKEFRRAGQRERARTAAATLAGSGGGAKQKR